MKSISGVASLIAVSLFLMGQAKSDRIVEAQKFVLKDASGRVGGYLAMDKFGSTLNLNDANGLPVVTLVGRHSPSLSLIRGEESISLAFAENGVTLGLYGKNAGLYKGIRAGLSVINDVPALSLYDKNGTELVTVDANMLGHGINLRDATGKLRAVFVLAKGRGMNEPTLMLIDKDDQVVWKAP